MQSLSWTPFYYFFTSSFVLHSSPSSPPACMQAKSLHTCLTLCDPMDCSHPGSSVHGILQGRILVGCHFLLQGIFPTQRSNPGLLHCRQTLPSEPPGIRIILNSYVQHSATDRNTVRSHSISRGRNSFKNHLILFILE